MTKDEIKQALFTYFHSADKHKELGEEFKKGWKGALLIAIELLNRLDE